MDPDVVVLIVRIIIMLLHQDQSLLHILEVHPEIFNQVTEPCVPKPLGFRGSFISASLVILS